MYQNVENPRVEGEGWTEGTSACDLDTETRPEATRVSTRRDMAKSLVVTESVSRSLNSTNRTKTTI